MQLFVNCLCQQEEERKQVEAKVTERAQNSLVQGKTGLEAAGKEAVFWSLVQLCPEKQTLHNRGGGHMRG